MGYTVLRVFQDLMHVGRWALQHDTASADDVGLSHFVFENSEVDDSQGLGEIHDAGDR